MPQFKEMTPPQTAEQLVPCEVNDPLWAGDRSDQEKMQTLQLLPHMQSIAVVLAMHVGKLVRKLEFTILDKIGKFGRGKQTRIPQSFPRWLPGRRNTLRRASGRVSRRNPGLPKEGGKMGWLRSSGPGRQRIIHRGVFVGNQVNHNAVGWVTRAQSFPSCGEVRKNGQEIPEGEGTWIAFPFHLIGINTGEAFDLEIVNASGVGIGQADFLQSTVSQGRENKRCRAKILWVVAAHGTPFTISGSGSRHSCGFPFHLPCASIELLRTRKKQ